MSGTEKQTGSETPAGEAIAAALEPTHHVIEQRVGGILAHQLHKGSQSGQELPLPYAGRRGPAAIAAGRGRRSCRCRPSDRNTTAACNA
jgi:hypothetical protein